MYDFIIFDLDGTVSDSIVGITRSINHSLRHHGYAEHSTANLLKYMGPPIDKTFSHLTGSSDKAHIISLVTVFRERYSRVGYSENKLYEGIAAALQALFKSGANLGVCTTKRSDFAEKILKLFDLRKYFKFVYGLHAAGVLWGYGSRAELSAHAPIFIFNSPAELIQLISAPDMQSEAAERAVHKSGQR
jgi:phosphoglycolate phosphatase